MGFHGNKLGYLIQEHGYPNDPKVQKILFKEVLKNGREWKYVLQDDIVCKNKGEDVKEFIIVNIPEKEFEYEDERDFYIRFELNNYDFYISYGGRNWPVEGNLCNFTITLCTLNYEDYAMKITEEDYFIFMKLLIDLHSDGYIGKPDIVLLKNCCG